MLHSNAKKHVFSDAFISIFHNPPKGDRREVVLVFGKSEFGGALPGSIQGQKSANRLKTRTRSHAFGAPLGFPEQIFYCQCRSSTLRATGTGVKYANFSASAIYTVKGGWISVKGGPAPFFKDRK